MGGYTKGELDSALKLVTSLIDRSQRIHGKFPKGTAQHTLLENRIRALYIAKGLMERALAVSGGEAVGENYSREDLAKALLPIVSIIHKNEKAQEKHEAGTAWYRRLERNIRPMYLAKALVEAALRAEGQMDDHDGFVVGGLGGFRGG